MFYLSANLKTVIIGKNLKTMGDNPFVSTKSLQNITIDKKNKYFKMVDGVLMDINETKIINYLETNKNKTYSISENTISSISLGVTINVLTGKCLMFPVTK